MKILMMVIVFVNVMFGGMFDDIKSYGSKEAAKLAQQFKRNMEGVAARSAMDEAKEQYREYTAPKADTRRVFNGIRLKFPVNNTFLYSNEHCDQVIQKRGAYISCYDYKAKLSLFLSYTLNGDALRSGYIQRESDSNRFYADSILPKRFRVSPYSFSKSGYDKGHVRSYASSAYSSEVINNTYSLVNIWAQTPTLNRKAWLKAEKYERQIARKLGSVSVLNIADVSDTHKRIGRDGVLVPDGFYKILYNQQAGYKKCFYYKNSVYGRSDTLKSHLIDCNKVYLPSSK